MAVDTMFLLFLSLSAMLIACTGVFSTVTAIYATRLLAVGTDTLAENFLAGVAAPWAGVLWFTTDFAAVTRVADLRSSAIYAASAVSMLI